MHRIFSLGFKRRLLGLLLAALLTSGCIRNKSMARAPVTSLPSVGYQGPAPEIENQSTSAPIMVETLPEPTATAAEAQPSLAPPAQLLPPPKPPKAIVESRREARASVPAPVDTRPAVAQAPPIQLLPQFSESDKQALSRKINEQLDSAQSLVDSFESHSTEQQKPNLAAVVDFMKKARDAMRRGELNLGLVFAQKANTLAASLVKTP